ncbi:MFS transporter permease [Parahaliea maris]|uniref:MFS transporter permease n=1 Tax=Parahaliea maris TaxID=2716870 RepID=A0A5C8ZYB9_9GAMM|nr:MFS transporter permease [Parahaliea maris]TXS92714.1 MFS transporter permease [Parahaliea maris]
MAAFSEQVYAKLVEEEDARVCRDIPESACADQPRAFTLQLLSQVLTKIGDTLTSSRLVLAWMLSSLGAPALYIAMLVPLRESLSLMPQLFVAQAMRGYPLRKVFWVAGSVGQGVCLLLMLPAVLALEGHALGITVVGLLALFSLSRGVCSVAAKDVLGKTVSKSRRGRLSGLAASASGAITLAVAGTLLLAPLFYSSDAVAGSRWFFAGLLAASAVLWLLAAMVYSGVPEVPGATEGGGNAITEALRSIGLLHSDADFRHFVISRMLLVSTAFAIPYLVVLIQQNSRAGGFGFATLLLAEGLAGLLSGNVWGRWSDHASEKVMASAASLSLLLMLATLALNFWHPAWLGFPPVAGLLLFFAAVAHHGVRIGRKTYLVDMASGGNRAQYTAVSNTVIGLFLLCGGGLGWVDARYGTATVLALLAALAVAAVWSSLRLKPVN